MLNSRRPHFLMTFHPNVSSDRLKVPEKFIKHLEGNLYGSVLLSGPSGVSWNVEVSMHDEELFFDDGWGMFVKDHSIECGDSFVFRYDGDLHFSVQIFDQTSCEKEVAFYAKHSEVRHFGEERGTGRELIPYSAAYSGNKSKTRSSYSPSLLEFEFVSKKPKLGEHGNDGLHSIRVPDEEKDHQPSCSSINERIRFASRNVVTMTMSSQGTPQMQHHPCQRKPKAIKEKRSTISTFIEQRASRYFVSEFPYFLRVMKASNVSGSGTLKLPVQFTKKYLPNCRTNIVLKNVKGDSWTLTSVPTLRVQTMHTLCGGWTGFVRDNGIKFEDICIFELVRDCEMRVRVVRLGTEGLDWDCLKRDINGSVESAQFVLNIDKPTNGPFVCNIGAAKSRGGASSEVQSFTSPFPYFTKVMMISNISGPFTMNIPSKFATAHFPGYRVEIILRNLEGERWTVNSYPSSVRCTAHTICGGWASFVRENNIMLGDTCVFELVGKEELQVHIFKNTGYIES